MLMAPMLAYLLYQHRVSLVCYGMDRRCRPMQPTILSSPNRQHGRGRLAALQKSINRREKCIRISTENISNENHLGIEFVWKSVHIYRRIYRRTIGMFIEFPFFNANREEFSGFSIAVDITSIIVSKNINCVQNINSNCLPKSIDLYKNQSNILIFIFHSRFRPNSSQYQQEFDRTFLKTQIT